MIPVADAHSDLALELVLRRDLADPYEALWAEQMESGGVRLQVLAAWAPPRYHPESSLRIVLEQLAACFAAIDRGDGLNLLTRGPEVADLWTRDRGTAFALALEGLEPLGESRELLDIFWRLGVRVFGLTWFSRNLIADGDAEPADAPLSRLGREIVERIRALGGIVDLAHASRSTVEEVLALDPPVRVMVSHAGCDRLHAGPRNLSDEHLRALSNANGIIGIMAHPVAIGKRATLERYAEHLEHAVSEAGVHKVCVGADFAKQLGEVNAYEASPADPGAQAVDLGEWIPGFEGPARYQELARFLTSERRWPQDQVADVLGRNLAGFLASALPE